MLLVPGVKFCGLAVLNDRQNADQPKMESRPEPLCYGEGEEKWEFLMWAGIRRCGEADPAAHVYVVDLHALRFAALRRIHGFSYEGSERSALL